MRTTYYFLFVTAVLTATVSFETNAKEFAHPSRLRTVMGKNEVLTAEVTTKTVATTAAPTTAAPTTAAPTTAEPTTAAPTTAAPTTAAPTTAAPTTAAPTTAAPTTAAPTTAAPTASPTTGVPTTKPTPAHCTPGQKKQVNGSCREYLECDKTFNWVQQSCNTWCHNFNPNSSKCEWSWKYHCVDPTTPSNCDDTTTSAASETTAAAASETTTTTAAPTTTTTVPTTTKVPPCEEGEQKVYQKGDCKDYLECDSGKWTKKSCSFGYDFDIDKLACTWSWWAKC